jgi:uncharacterized damage-inducible protein DinB
MTNREFYLQRHQAELPVFVKVLKALPADRLEYKPHDRCPSAQQLLATLSGEYAVCLNVVTERKGEWMGTPPAPYDEMVATFERAAKAVADRVAVMDDAGWNQNAQFFYEGKMVSEQPIGQFLWMILFDAIHHRGQLCAYLRPMGAKVPAIYGPSADERPS